jgi:hypothetical protein
LTSLIQCNSRLPPREKQGEADPRSSRRGRTGLSRRSEGPRVGVPTRLGAMSVRVRRIDLRGVTVSRDSHHLSTAGERADRGISALSERARQRHDNALEVTCDLLISDGFLYLAGLWLYQSLSARGSTASTAKADAYVIKPTSRSRPVNAPAAAPRTATAGRRSVNGPRMSADARYHCRQLNMA